MTLDSDRLDFTTMMPKIKSIFLSLSLPPSFIAPTLTGVVDERDKIRVVKTLEKHTSHLASERALLHLDERIETRLYPTLAEHLLGSLGCILV